MEQQLHHTCKQTKSKQRKQNHVTSYSNWPLVLLFFLSYKQCNGIIEEWLLISESKGRFLVCNILTNLVNVWLSMMSGHGTNSIFTNKKDKDWTSITLAIPPPLPYLDNISVLIQPQACLSKWATSYIYQPLVKICLVSIIVLLSVKQSML